ncbi:tRNA 2 -phosphotransferase 1 [Lecanosticta acicola]|uniref:2'-phosphotransferase n=1 Tax=Lecanosticta acicola TaxID=111012 RepID=A0AAI8Z0Z0_9PEZI|nr:tRNA 2 -phosphotransferase 1 [Lecanosticta acicola]
MESLKSGAAYVSNSAQSAGQSAQNAVSGTDKWNAMTEEQKKQAYENLPAEQKQGKTYMEWIQEGYQHQKENWMPWIEDMYLKWFTNDNKASYATKDTLDKSKVTGVEQVDTLQDSVNNAVGQQVGKGGVLQPVGDMASKEGVNRAERGGKDDSGSYGGAAGDSVMSGAQGVGNTLSSGAQGVGGALGLGGRGGRGGGGRGGPLPRPVQVSKKISWLLRHGAAEEGLTLLPGGFLPVDQLLSNRKIRSLKVTLDEVREIVTDNDKQRFTMVHVSQVDPTTGAVQESVEISDEGDGTVEPKEFLIRANQGHSIKVESEGLLKPITDENRPETAVHGTTHSAWPKIVASGGLKPMGRNHVHLASGLPAGFTSLSPINTSETATAPVISGMRNSSTILIFIDLEKAMAAGVKFWLSDNGVILSEGNENGVVPLEVFKRVEDRTGEGLLVEDGKIVKEAPVKWSAKA